MAVGAGTLLILIAALAHGLALRPRGEGRRTRRPSPESPPVS
jgi:hypothetical protein